MKFFDIETHTGSGIAHIILEFFKKIEVNIEDCSGQSYDNASNMSGKYKGMQAIIKEKSKNAMYIPCCAHSLNLVGQCAVDCCIPATSFFGFVQKLYVFFSSSTKRWKVLTDCLAVGNQRGLTVKSLSETRWSASYDAITALMSGYDKIYEALVTLVRDDSQKPETKVEAQGLTKSIQTLETSLITVIWQTTLERFHKTTIILQGENMDLNNATALLKGLVVFVQSLRTQFDIFEQRAKSHSACVDYYKSSRIRPGNPKYDIHPEDTSNSLRDKFLNSTFFVVIDKLEAELMFRLKAYQDVSHRFSFLKNLSSSPLDDIRY